MIILYEEKNSPVTKDPQKNVTKEIFWAFLGAISLNSVCVVASG